MKKEIVSDISTIKLLCLQIFVKFIFLEVRYVSGVFRKKKFESIIYKKIQI
jgi:hypothetical protein